MDYVKRPIPINTLEGVMLQVTIWEKHTHAALLIVEENFHRKSIAINMNECTKFQQVKICVMCVTFVTVFFDNVDSLKQHKLQHSSSKKFICRYCKVHGYTRSND